MDGEAANKGRMNTTSDCFLRQGTQIMSGLARGYMLVLIVVVAACGQSLAPGEAALRVAAWTSRGERIEKIWVVVSSLDGRKRYMGNGRDVALSVPTGEYVLQVEAPGFPIEAARVEGLPACGFSQRHASGCMGAWSDSVGSNRHSAELRRRHSESEGQADRTLWQ
jgi:hypothetical protein